MVGVGAGKVGFARGKLVENLFPRADEVSAGELIAGDGEEVSASHEGCDGNEGEACRDDNAGLGEGRMLVMGIEQERGEGGAWGPRT